MIRSCGTEHHKTRLRPEPTYSVTDLHRSTIELYFCVQTLM